VLGSVGPGRADVTREPRPARDAHARRRHTLPLVYADDVLARWSAQTLALLPPIALFDAHTHIGSNDPDGFTCSAEELLQTLTRVRSRAVVFPMREPGGYPRANDHVIAQAAASDDTLVAFCRVDPGREAVAEVRRCLAAGARGIKLHPRAEGFGMLEPAVRAIVAEAHARRLPVLVHAGRGIPALGEHVLALAAEFGQARFILAHAGVCDLAWIWQRAPEFPNVFFDTAWYSTRDLLALFSLVPPGQILYATDIPYGTPPQSVVSTFRSALQAGLTAEQLASVAGGQLERLIAGAATVDLGPAPGPGGLRSDPLLERVGYFVVCAIAAGIVGGDTAEFIDLARLACLVGSGVSQATHCAAIDELLQIALTLPMGETLSQRFTHIHCLFAASAIAATPDVPVT
jgi:uncharacterized protein